MNLYSQTLEMDMWKRVKWVSLVDGQNFDVAVVAVLRDAIVVKSAGDETYIIPHSAITTAELKGDE